MNKMKKIMIFLLTVILILLNVNVRSISATEVNGSLMGMIGYKIWINNDKSASDTVLGQTILEARNFDTSGRTSQAVVAPASGNAEFKLNAAFFLNQAQQLPIIGMELWSILLKPSTNSVSTLSSTQNATYSHVDLAVEFNDFLDYTDTTGLIKNAYFDSDTWRPIYVFDENYTVLEDFRDNSQNTYQPGVSKKVFNIRTGGKKKFIIRVIPISDVTFTTAQKTKELKFGLDEANNFTISEEKANELAEKRRSMTEQQIIDERTAIDKVINQNNKLTPAQLRLIKEYNLYATGEVTGEVFVDKSMLSGFVALLAPDSLPLTGMIPASGIAVTYKNPSVLFLKNDGSDIASTAIREDIVTNGRVYVDYNGAIPTDSLTQYSVPSNPTRDGYEFVGWSKNATATTADFNPNTEKISEDTLVYAVWRKEELKYTVTHEFKVADGITQTLPQEIKDRVNGKDIVDLVDGSIVTPNTEISTTSVADTTNDGTWTFVEWDQTSHTINKANGKFVGTWTFTPNQYEIIHEFKVADGITQTLPQEIKDRVNGKTIANLINGDTRTLDSTISTTSVADTTNDGTWTFVEWDQTSHTINKANGKFVGTWNFVENTYKATFEFTSQTVGKPLPQAVLDKLPIVKDGLVNTTIVTPLNITESVEDEANDGTWTFVEWNKAEDVINKADVHFIGKWVFSANRYKITHKFISGTDGITLPEEILNRVPAEVVGERGTQQGPSSFNQNDVQDTVNNGVWTFKQWNKTTLTFGTDEKEFIGVWEFTPNESLVEHRGNVIVRFVNTDGEEILQSVTNRNNVLVKTVRTVGVKQEETLTNATYDINENKEQKIDFNNEEYVYSHVQDNVALTGNVEVGTKTITLVYRQAGKITETITGTVFVQFKDEFDNIIQKLTLKDNVVVKTIIKRETGTQVSVTASGEQYDASAVKSNEIEFEGYEYEFLRLEGGEVEAGVVKEGETTITYIYKVIPKVSVREENGFVTVNYVDTDGNKLKDEVFNRKDVITKRYEITTTPQNHTEVLVDIDEVTFDTTENKLEMIEVNGKKYKLVEHEGHPSEQGVVVTGRTNVTYIYELVKTDDSTSTDVVIEKNDNQSEITPVQDFKNEENETTKKSVDTSDTTSNIWVVSIMFSLFVLLKLRKNK